MKQTLENLQLNLESIGGHLIIEYGCTEQIIHELVEVHSISKIYTEQEYAAEELHIMETVKTSVAETTEMITFWGKTLYHIDDIPFTIDKIPLTSKAYRIPTSKQAEVREPFKAPSICHSLVKATSKAFPEFSELGFSGQDISEAKPFVPGGETAALNRLQHYTFDTEQLTGYRSSRNKSLGMDYSSKFSPYLALGSLSPRTDLPNCKALRNDRKEKSKHVVVGV